MTVTQSTISGTVPRTIAEKILGRSAGRPVRAGEIVIAPLDLVFWDDASRPQAFQVFRELGGKTVFNPVKVTAFQDHAALTQNAAVAQVHRAMREFCTEQGVYLHGAGEGIEHQLVAERGLAGPGDIVVGADSHTCTIGALNAFGVGVGSSDLATGLLTGKLWFKVPHTIRVNLEGRLPDGVFSKDVILHLLSLLGVDGAVYQAIEYTGPALAHMSMESRFVLTNMVAEMGAKTGLMEIDDVARQWLQGRYNRPYTAFSSDEGAQFSRMLSIDVSHLAPQVARPPNPANVSPVGDVVGIPIQQAVIGTCTNARLEDLRIAAQILAGHAISPNVRLFVTASSRAVFQQAASEGIISAFVQAGAILGPPGCGGCTGGSGFAIPADGMNVISTANRNFQGRLGNTNADIYLASPATVMASAIRGEITDPRSYQCA